MLKNVDHYEESRKDDLDVEEGQRGRIQERRRIKWTELTEEKKWLVNLPRRLKVILKQPPEKVLFK